jgi:hypothetical protein
MAEFQNIDPEKFKGLTGYSAAVFEKGYNGVFRQKLIRIETPSLFLGIYR